MIYVFHNDSDGMTMTMTMMMPMMIPWRCIWRWPWWCGLHWLHCSQTPLLYLLYLLPYGNNLLYMSIKYLKMICIVKLFKILFKGLDVFMFVTHLEVKISPWDNIEGLSLLMLSFIYLINPLLFFISFLNCTNVQ